MKDILIISTDVTLEKTSINLSHILFYFNISTIILYKLILSSKQLTNRRQVKKYI